MSENNVELTESDQIHYVYTDQGFILGENAITTELGDIICDDVKTTTAILVDGQYYLTDGNQHQTIVLQQENDENINFPTNTAAAATTTQYYFNNDTGEFIVQEDLPTINQFIENSQIVQLVGGDDGEELTNDSDQQQQPIIFCNANDLLTQIDGDLLDDVGVQDEDGNVYPVKRIKLENDLFEIQEEHDDFINNQQQIEDGVKYTILNSDEIQFENNEQQFNNESSSSPIVEMDISKITGRNLITGQTVTLHSYLEKLKRKFKNVSIPNVSTKNNNSISEIENKCNDLDDNSENELFEDLLDKKIPIGKTKSGKNLIGKIVHVEKKSLPLTVINNESKDVVQDQINANDNNITQELEKISTPITEEQLKIIVKRPNVSKDSFEEISKTLGGVMEMESVRKKLENKNIVVKLIEKRYISESDSTVKTTSYSYGYMEKEFVDVAGVNEEKWKFVSDQNTQDAILNDNNESTNNEIFKKNNFAITIVISYLKNNTKSIRVNLNPSIGNTCSICGQYFKSNLQLRLHMDNIHNNTYGSNNKTQCEVCHKTFSDFDQLEQHKNIHIEEGKWFVCSECKKSFTTQNRLVKHVLNHENCLKQLTCSLCDLQLSSEYALKKHLVTHTGFKPYNCDICHKLFLSKYDANFHKKKHYPTKHFACNVCMRTFSRHSNLLRHAEIHKGNGANYKCEICSCSYNYISSLTRHMVQNHLDVADFKKKIAKIQEDNNQI